MFNGVRLPAVSDMLIAFDPARFLKYSAYADYKSRHADVSCILCELLWESDPDATLGEKLHDFIAKPRISNTNGASGKSRRKRSG